MRKIALISEHASPLVLAGGVDSGGQNVYVAHVARQLALNGFSVDVFTRRDDPALPTVVDVEGLYRVINVPAGPCRPLPKERLLRYMARFTKCLVQFARAEERRGSPYDLLHANFFMSGLAALAAKRRLGTPVVTTFHALGKVRRLHQAGADRFPDARFAIEEELAQSSDRIVAECEQDREDLLELYGADERRIDIVPCGFDANELFPVAQAEARSALGWKRAEFCVLQLGRLVPRKGIEDVIRAVGVLRNRTGKSAKLYVVGGESQEPDEFRTPEIRRLRGIARSAGVERLVEFVGRRNRDVLRLYYAACDVFVTTPWYEPFGITPVEAMACARPVIGAAVGGIRTTVVDGMTGYLVPARNPEAIAERLEHLMSDPQEAVALGAAGRVRALTHFTWARVVEGLAYSYERAIERRMPIGLPLTSPKPGQIGTRPTAQRMPG